MSISTRENKQSYLAMSNAYTETIIYSPIPNYHRNRVSNYQMNPIICLFKTLYIHKSGHMEESKIVNREPKKLLFLTLSQVPLC